MLDVGRHSIHNRCFLLFCLPSLCVLLLLMLRVSLQAALDQATVSRGWLLLPLAIALRPMASRPLAVVCPGRLEGRPLKLPGAEISASGLLCRSSSHHQGKPQLILFFPKAHPVAAFLQRNIGRFVWINNFKKGSFIQTSSLMKRL